jgi:hypothetical protein
LLALLVALALVLDGRVVVLFKSVSGGVGRKGALCVACCVVCKEGKKNKSAGEQAMINIDCPSSVWGDFIIRSQYIVLYHMLKEEDRGRGRVRLGPGKKTETGAGDVDERWE